MKVLIVDDSNEKVRDILAVLISAGLSEDEDIDVASCAQAAARHLKANDYGLMILDLHLPIRLSEEPRNDGGSFLLKEIGRRKELRRPEHILGLTAHDEAKASAEPEFNKGLWSIVKASSDSSEWKEAILEKVRYLRAR
ncbi:response regulator, partial [Roseibium sp.]